MTQPELESPETVAGELLADAPEPTQSAAPDSPPPEPIPAASNGLAAPYGVKADGTPRKGPQGRRGPAKPAPKVVLPEGKKPKVVIPGQDGQASPVEVIPAGEEPFNEEAARALGPVIVQTLVSSLVSVFGEDFKTEEKEAESMSKAWGDYLVACRVTAPPPWVMVAFTTAAYVAPRLTKPTVQERLAVMVLKVRRFFGKDGEAA